MVITGAGGAVGSALMDAFHGKAANVTGIVRSGSEKWNLKPGFHLVKADMLDEATVQKVVREIISRLGSIHVWLNAAGGFAMGKSVVNTSLEDWESMLSVNLRTALSGIKAVLPSFTGTGYGRIINFGSAAVNTGMAHAAPYVVSKSAVVALTQCVVLEINGDITCNAILPGIIDTPVNRNTMPGEDFSRWTSIETIAETIGEIISSGQSGEIVIV